MTSTYKPTLIDKETRGKPSQHTRTGTRQIRGLPGTLHLRVHFKYKQIKQNIWGSSTVANIKTELRQARMNAYNNARYQFIEKNNLQSGAIIQYRILEEHFTYYMKGRGGKTNTSKIGYKYQDTYDTLTEEPNLKDEKYETMSKKRKKELRKKYNKLSAKQKRQYHEDIQRKYELNLSKEEWRVMKKEEKENEMRIKKIKNKRQKHQRQKSIKREKTKKKSVKKITKKSKKRVTHKEYKYRR
jgi:hypothetical protein